MEGIGQKCALNPNLLQKILNRLPMQKLLQIQLLHSSFYNKRVPEAIGDTFTKPVIQELRCAVNMDFDRMLTRGFKMKRMAD